MYALFIPSYSLWQTRGIRIIQVQAFATKAICQAAFACQGCTSPYFYLHSVREPLGSAYPFRYKSNTRYVPLTRKGPKYKVLVYYFSSWQIYSLPFLTMNIFWGAIMCQALYWTLGIWIWKRQFAHQECLATMTQCQLYTVSTLGYTGNTCSWKKAWKKLLPILVITRSLFLSHCRLGCL